MSTADQSEGDINLTEPRTNWITNDLDERTRALLAEDARYFFHQSLSTPCLNVLTGCDGSYLEDVQGRRFFDFHGNSVHQVGFGNPAVIQAIAQQMQELSFCPRRYTNETAVALAKKLAQLAPGDLNRVLFTPSGTTAVGLALKLARIVTGRHKVVAMWDAFHGASLDAISVSGERLFREGVGPLLPGVSHVPPPDEYRCLWECHQRGGCDLKCASYIDYVLQHEGDVAAVIAEPVRTIPYIPRPEYWQAVREICDRHQALLIFDEIPHALGRTGKMFTCEHFGIIPDLLLLGKGLGGGILPLAAIIGRDAFNSAVSQMAIGHYTHEKNPVLCAAGLATLTYIEEHNLLSHVQQLGQQTLQQLQAMQQQFPIIGDVRGLGLLLGVELVTDPQTKVRATTEAEAVMYAALRRGLSFKVTNGNTLLLLPPLTVTAQEMDTALEILAAAFGDLAR